MPGRHERTLQERLRQADGECQRLGQLEHDLNQLLVERTAHIQSLEDKHRQAREALKHFRQQHLSQREQETQRHDAHRQAVDRMSIGQMRNTMNTDTFFGSLVSSAMRLSTGLLVTLGLALLLLMINFWTLALLFGSQQEKAVSHFARVMENVREQEILLQAIADRLVAPMDAMQGAPPVLRQVRQSTDTANAVSEARRSDCEPARE